MLGDQYRLFGLVQVSQDFCGLALKVRNKLNFHGSTLNQTDSDTIVSLLRARISQLTQNAPVTLTQRSGDKGVRVPRLVKLLSFALKDMPHPENNDGTGMN